ncbi:MAG: hypothetical protein V3U98_03260 [Acidobacteriota bacterium]
MKAASLPNPPPQGPGPDLKIFATRYMALAPASVTVYARLSGVARHDSRFCHAGETWITGRLEGHRTLNTISRHDPRCVHKPDRTRASTTFAKDYYFSRPGSYTCRLVLNTNDGRLVQSNMITITVR